MIHSLGGPDGDCRSHGRPDLLPGTVRVSADPLGEGGVARDRRSVTCHPHPTYALLRVSSCCSVGEHGLLNPALPPPCSANTMCLLHNTKAGSRYKPCTAASKHVSQSGPVQAWIKLPNNTDSALAAIKHTAHATSGLHHCPTSLVPLTLLL